MKKIVNKLFLLLMVAFVGITLTGCKDKTEAPVEYNKNVPTGSLSSEVYATSADGKYSITELQLYNEMRANGYDYLFEEILEILVTPAQYNLNITDNSEELIEIIDKKCFGTSEKDEINKLTKESYDLAIKQFVDQMYLMNVVIEGQDIYADNVKTYFLKQLSQKYFAISELNNPASKYYWANEYEMLNGDYVYDENGVKTLNQYYIDEETIENNFTINHDEVATYEVVVLATDTLAEAQALIDETALEGKNAAEKFTIFQNCYKTVNSYKTVTADTFKLTDKDLSVYNSTLVSVIKNMKAGEHKLYLQFGSKVYSVFLNAEKPEADYSTITAEEKAALVQEILDEQTTETLVSKILIDKVYNTNVVIYDYVYDALYAAENSKHTRLTAAQWTPEFNNYVASVTFVENGQQVTKHIKVDDFFKTLEEILGITTALDYFSSKALIDSTYVSEYTYDEAETTMKEYYQTIATFHEGGFEEYGYPASIGEDVFKFIYYGTTDEAEIFNYFKSQLAWTYYVKSRPENYASVLYNIGKDYYNEYFDLSVKHILITVDYNSDGTPDDPELFIKELNKMDKTGALAAQFEQTVVEAMTAITTEINYIVEEKKYASMVDALDYISKAFYANEELLSDSTKTWASYKKFGIGLTIEDLGSVNNTSASRYVKEFGLGVKDLYDYLVGEEIVKDGSLSKDYLDTRFTADGLTVSEKLAKLIKTSYGYHILSAYKTTKVSSAKYTEDDDSNEQFKEVTIKQNDVEVVKNAYNEEDWASINQIEIYLAQVNTDDGVTGLPSAVKTYINKYYSTLETEYSNDTFRNILFAETTLKIQFSTKYSYNTAKYTEFMRIQKDKYESYADTTKTVDMLANLWNLVYIDPIQ